MTDIDRYQKFKEWAQGIPLDGTKDYHVLKGFARFEAYEEHIKAEAIECLIEKQEKT